MMLVMTKLEQELFNVVNSKKFKLMVEAIGNYGPCLKVPSECRVPPFKDLEYTRRLLNERVMKKVYCMNAQLCRMQGWIKGIEA
ncbi:hypothetical protein JHK87_041627 [Glycine soja]|nr:hypothetical protein JHK87_041627 [Glycine soja]